MATITNFRCVDANAREIACDAFGNNVALKCPRCGHPILATARDNQRGSSAANAAVCRSCDLQAWLSVDAEKRLLRFQASQDVPVKAADALEVAKRMAAEQIKKKWAQ